MYLNFFIHLEANDRHLMSRGSSLRFPRTSDARSRHRKLLSVSRVGVNRHRRTGRNGAGDRRRQHWDEILACVPYEFAIAILMVIIFTRLIQTQRCLNGFRSVWLALAS